MPAAFTAATVVLLVRDQGGYFPVSWGWGALALAGVFLTWILATARTDAAPCRGRAMQAASRPHGCVANRQRRGRGWIALGRRERVWRGHAAPGRAPRRTMAGSAGAA